MSENSRRAVLRTTTSALAAIFGGLGLAACRQEAMRQPTNVPFSGYASAPERARQITTAAEQRGWTARSVMASAGGGGAGGTTQLAPAWGQPNQAQTRGRAARAVPAIEATNNRDGHNVVVQILYDQNSFSVRYVSSVGLNYDGQNIHTYYNGLVDQLVRQIQQTPA